ncbi:hypothetical protein DITRI_Ditri01bG0113900 [Diplodiscus trichospermus]
MARSPRIVVAVADPTDNFAKWNLTSPRIVGRFIVQRENNEGSGCLVVYDLGQEAPDKVLRRVYVRLAKLKQEKDEFAAEIHERLRIVVAGGDGTAGWLLGVVCDLKLPHPPPIATVPLGTGNNLPFSFGWGKKNPGTDPNSVLSFFEQVMVAKEMKLDNWHILMRMRTPKEGSCDPIAPLELPHSLHSFGHVSSTDELHMEGYHTFRGGFWNYFSMGMDTQVSYAFHSEKVASRKI